MQLPLTCGYAVFSAPQHRVGQLDRACGLCVGGHWLQLSLSDFHVQHHVSAIFSPLNLTLIAHLKNNKQTK
jgi:hypothetical protein